jgi:hypothetical protein
LLMYPQVPAQAKKKSSGAPVLGFPIGSVKGAAGLGSLSMGPPLGGARKGVAAVQVWCVAVYMSCWGVGSLQESCCRIEYGCITVVIIVLRILVLTTLGIIQGVPRQYSASVGTGFHAFVRL